MKWLLSVLLLIFVAWILPGVSIESFWTAIVVSIVLGLVQMGASLIFLLLFPVTATLTIITFGIFLALVNAFCIQITSNLVGGFHVESFGYALLFGLTYSFLYSLFIGNKS